MCLTESEVKGFSQHYPEFAELLAEVHEGQCCIDQGRYAAMFRRPSIADKINSVTNAGMEWVASGMPLVSASQLETRKAICSGCDQFDGWRCAVCGCAASVKLRMATSACPVGKWGAIT